ASRCRIRRVRCLIRERRHMDLPVQQFRTKGEQVFLDMFEQGADVLPGARDPFVSGLRRKAIEAYGRLGLPHRRVEAWKYTDLRSRLTDAYPLISATGTAVGETELSKAIGSDFVPLPAHRLVIVEGGVRADLSGLSGLKAAGVEVVSLAQALEKPSAWLKKTLGHVNPREDDPVIALNTALMTGGVALRIGGHVTLDKPIHLIQLDGKGEPCSTVTRNVIIAEPGSSAMVLESYGSFGNGGLQGHGVTRVGLHDQAAVNHVKLQREGGDAIHLTTWLVKLGADARYDAFQVSLGAALARNQIYAQFTGEGSQANISGAFLLRDRQHCDTTILVEHLVP